MDALEEKEAPKLFVNSVWWNSDTGLKQDGTTNTLVEMVLPQKAGKYLVSFTSLAYANAANGYWIYYYFKCGGTTLNPGGGQYLYANCSQSYGVPISGSAVVELNGNENQQQRTLQLVHYPHSSHPSGMKSCCIHCFELSP